MQDDWNNPPEQQPTAESEAALAVDLQGIPILNEVVEPDELEPTGSANPDQSNLSLFDLPQSAVPPPQAVDLEALREQLWEEMLQVIEQTTATLTERFRTELEQNLVEGLDRVLEERLLRSNYDKLGHDAE